MNKYVVDIYADDYERFKKNACTYCGDTTSIVRDHVVSVDWSGFRRSYRKGDTVPCCRECNSILSNKPLHSISSRANFISCALYKKYRKIINHPNWSDDELLEMSIEFSSTLKCRGNAKSFVEARVLHAQMMALDDASVSKIKAQASDDGLKYKALSDLYFGYSYTQVSEKIGVPVNRLKTWFKLKSSSNLVSLFKYEIIIPFDYPIYHAIFDSQAEFKRKMNSGKVKI